MIQKRKKLIVLIVSFLVLAILSLILWYAIAHLMPSSKVVQLSHKDLINIFDQAARELQQRFEGGDVENLIEKGLSQCEQELIYNQFVGSHFYRCNPNYLECFLRGKISGLKPEFKINYRDKNYLVKARADFPPIPEIANYPRYTKILSKVDFYHEQVFSYGILLNLQIHGFKNISKIILKNTCSDIYLPRRTYNHAPSNIFHLKKSKTKESDSFYWNNYHRNIYVDKFLVSKRDIFEWNAYDKRSNEVINVENDRKKWGEAATGLSLSQMQDFCHFRGKHLLQAHILDAASFLPENIDETNQSYIVNTPYYWSRTGRVDKIFTEERMSQEDCQNIYTQECRSKFPYNYFNTNKVSWIGLGDVLGGPPERVDNKKNSSSFIKASSWLIERNPQLHQIGIYLKPEHFEDNEKSLAFRCMSYVYD